MKTTTLLVAAGLFLAACASTHTKPTTNLAYEGEMPQRTFRFTYEANLPATGPNDKMEMWIPYPVDTTEQEIDNVKIESNQDYKVNPLERGTGKSIYLTTMGKDINVKLSFDVTRQASSGGTSATSKEIEMGLKANSMIPATGKVSQIAASMPSGANTMQTAEALYRHTFDRMRYDKPAGGEWGRGDSEWACDSRYGNCTDFHSYFMGLARTKGIPTRFVMGFPIPSVESEETKVGGYHCWAYFYDEAEGWRPVDISEADKHPEKVDYFFGNIDENRVEMIGGRDVLLKPAPTVGALNLFIYPYAQTNGKETRELTKSFSIENR